MNCHHTIVTRKAQLGSSLLEVLITILILSFGLLGIAGLTVASLQSAKMSQFQSTALQLANEYADRMRGNAPGVAAQAYDMTSAYTAASGRVSVPACATANACTAAELAAIDRAEWTNNLRRRLPAGGAYVQHAAAGLAVDMWLIWSEPGLQHDPDPTRVLASSGGSQCPAEALAGYSGDRPLCVYYRVSI